MANAIEGRNERIMGAALQMAEAHGYDWITREQVAQAAGVATGTVSKTFGTVREMKRAVLREAVKRKLLPIIAQGLAAQHPLVLEAPAELRRMAALRMAG